MLLFHFSIFVIGSPFSVSQERFDVEGHHRNEPDRSENHHPRKDGHKRRIFLKNKDQAWEHETYFSFLVFICSSDAREIYHIYRISRKTHHSISLNPLLLFLHAALEFLRLKVLATRTKHPYVQFTRLQRLSVGLSQRYATRFSDLVKWIKQSHMFTRGHAKHPCK